MFDKPHARYLFEMYTKPHIMLSGAAFAIMDREENHVPRATVDPRLFSRPIQRLSKK
jgi:hypothetical protein